MTLDDTARVLKTLRADLAVALKESVRPWDRDTALAVFGLVDQRLWNISTAADFHDRATRSEL